ncbi:glycoside hydrolase family 16 protein, partial [Zasmidium cellare ATCC 36951]
PAVYDHLFVPENARVQDGFLELVVPGGQTENPIRSAEVFTWFNVLYGSVRTYAILTEEPGVCNGMFMYFDDNQETDIEWISDPESFANVDANNGTRAMLYTNQNLVEGVDATTVSGRSAVDATSAVHEYRLDWTEDATRFYLDGVLQQTITENVPTVPGQWLWNNWVNGDPYFTAGPPVGDAVFKIQKIVMF